MRLLTKTNYDTVEELLKVNTSFANLDEPYKSAMKEITDFFKVPIYEEFLKLFYFERYKYKNRFPDNRAMIQYLCEKLYTSEPQLYTVRKEIVYKSAMIFYKYNINVLE